MPPQADESRIPDLASGLALALPDQYGRVHRLADYRGRNVVLYFYPKDDTPGCTVEGKEFRELHEQFLAQECVVIGVSTDSVESHRAFAEKHAFPFTLLSDSSGDLARAFGVFNEGMAGRSTFILDRENRIARAFHDVTPRGHAQRMLNFVRTLLESHRMLGG
jgi:peroxiredoxin Q/BCP